MELNDTPIIILPSPFLLKERTFPNLGAIQVATHYGTGVIDLTGDNEYIETIRKLRGSSFGISSTSPQYPIAVEVARELKEYNPKVKLILGGPHATVLQGRMGDPNYQSMSLVFDYVIGGDADQDLDLNRWFVNAPLIKNIDNSIIPDRSKIDINSYAYEIDGKKATSIMTQRGCPFTCTFCCGRDIESYRKSRQHSSKRVAYEMEYLNKEFGFEGFMWYDDEININPGRLSGIADLIEGKYVHRGFVRADLINNHPESLEHLTRIGFSELCFGLESGDPQVLRNIDKGITPVESSLVIRRIKEAGLRCKVFVALGLPGETENSIKNTKRWLKEEQPDSFNISVFNPYPGSRIYDFAEPTNEMPGYCWKYGDLYFNKPDFEKEQTFYMADDMIKCNVRTKELSSEDILNLRQEVINEN